jgi:hypothetical protein
VLSCQGQWSFSPCYYKINLLANDRESKDQSLLWAVELLEIDRYWCVIENIVFREFGTADLDKDGGVVLCRYDHAENSLLKIVIVW